MGLQYGYDPSGHIAWNCRKKLNFGSSNEVDDVRIKEVGKGESMSWVKKIPPQFLNYFNHQSGGPTFPIVELLVWAFRVLT